MSQDSIESVLHESRTFAPPADFAAKACLSSMEAYRAMHRRSLEEPEAFWSEIAEELHWFKRWDRVFDDSDKPFYQWFVGGKTNLCYNAVDRHLDGPRADATAIIWEGEPGEVITFTYRCGKVLELKSVVDKGVAECPTIERVLVIPRDAQGERFSCAMSAGRDVWYDQAVATVSDDCPCEELDSEDMAFLLYTSGSTGKPKGIMHTVGGYGVFAYLTSKYVFDLRDDDIYWCTADIGWITGHSYIIYGPLQNGATILMYEGAPNYPQPDRFWEIVEKHKVTVFYTAPTAIRAFMKWGDEWVTKHDLSSLRLLGSVGEPINPEAWMWYHEQIGGQRCPIVDTWWQTETGGILLTPLPGVTPTKPGSATLPFFGVDAAVLNMNGQEVEAGLLAIRQPWPSMMRGVWGDPERFKSTYWCHWDGEYYFPGDGARRDDDGYFWIVGRVDDVVNVSGHRIGTAELESCFVEHPLVSESAVIGVPHEIRGQGLVAFVSLRGSDRDGSDELRAQLNAIVIEKIGKFARPEKIIFSADLPKTRSGKIMRRLLRDIATGGVLGNVTTLADPSVVDDLKRKYGA